MQRKALLLLPCALAVFCTGIAQARDDDNRAKARLSGFQEVLPISTAGAGRFEATLSPSSFSFELSYSGLTSHVQQAHIHFGQKGVNGGISVFLCSNLPSPPAGTQACPSPSGTVTGTITAANVIGPAGQNISAGQFDALIRAMRNGTTYANVHSDMFPSGEIRGQIKVDD
jgi:CHRD domain